MLESIVAQVVDDLVWIPLYLDEQAYVVAEGLSWEPRNDSLVLPAEMTRSRPRP